jgi:hypothetical protein
MPESTKFIIIRKLLKAPGFSDESIDDVMKIFCPERGRRRPLSNER